MRSEPKKQTARDLLRAQLAEPGGRKVLELSMAEAANPSRCTQLENFLAGWLATALKAFEESEAANVVPAKLAELRALVSDCLSFGPSGNDAARIEALFDALAQGSAPHPIEVYGVDSRVAPTRATRKGKPHAR